MVRPIKKTSYLARGKFSMTLERERESVEGNQRSKGKDAASRINKMDGMEKGLCGRVEWGLVGI
jgi:hypothetical protein